MMRRRTALSGLPVALLTACAAPKPKIAGKQIPVIAVKNQLEVSPEAPPVTLPPAQALSSWPQDLANPANVPGNVAAPLGLKQIWKADIGEGGSFRTLLRASPVTGGGQIYTMDANAVVQAHAPADGKMLWRTVTRPKHVTMQNMGGGIAYDSGKIYASTGYGELLAIDAASGKILWRQSTDLPCRSMPLVANGMVFVAIYNDVLLTFDAATGTPGWRFSGNAGQPSSAAVGVTGAPAFADGIVVCGFSTGMLAGIDVTSGTPLWEQSLASGYGQSSELDFSDIVAAPIITGGVVYAINLADTFMAVDLHSGVKVWTHAAGGINSPAAAGGFLFVVDATQKLSAVHADDGLVSWVVQLPAFKNQKKKSGPIQWAGPLLANGQLVLSSDNGQFAIVDAVKGKLIEGGKIGAPADIGPIAAAGQLLQLTRNAKLTAYE